MKTTLKKTRNILVLVMFFLGSPVLIGANESKSFVDLNEEIKIKKFTFELNSHENRSKVEKLFSDKSKFLHFKFLSQNRVLVYTELDVTIELMNDLLAEVGNRTKSLEEELITKEKYYQEIN